MANYRRGALFVRDPLGHSTPLDRNQRARLLFIAEGLDRATKAKGRRNGVLGYVGLVVLRCLLLRFHNAKTGLCCPSYSAIQEATGLCRQSIASAMQRLVASGLLGIVRRLHRVVCDGVVRCQQATNLYRFTIPAGPIPVPLVVPRVRQRPAVVMPNQGSIGDLARALMRRRESMGEGVTNNIGNPIRTRSTAGEPDWRSAARQMFMRAKR